MRDFLTDCLLVQSLFTVSETSLIESMRNMIEQFLASYPYAWSVLEEKVAIPPFEQFVKTLEQKRMSITINHDCSQNTKFC